MFGLIKENTMVTGIKIKCMAMELLDGLMEDLMKDSNYCILYFRYREDKKQGKGTFIWSDGR